MQLQKFPPEKETEKRSLTDLSKMPQCCNGCCWVDLIPDCIDQTCCWRTICCEKCCATNPSNGLDKCCGKCVCDLCPCLPNCESTRYQCCTCVCCYANIVWDPCALFCGPYKGDINILKKEKTGVEAPPAEEMIRE